MISGNMSTSGMHPRKLGPITAMIKDYLRSASEDSLSELQRRLTLLESSDDSLHDVSAVEQVQFFYKLHDILLALPSTNPLVWNIISILQKMCASTNESHHSTLSEMFVPVLVKLLSESLTIDKKLRLLGVLQVLTWNIEILWQVPYLQPTFKTVCASVMSADPKEASLSLSIVVNLLHRNPPARNTFLRCIKVKDFLKQLLRSDIKFLEFRHEVSKFMLLMADLSNIHAYPKEVQKFVEMTFQTVHECVRNENVSLIQHTVKFFEDATGMEQLKPNLLQYPSFVAEIEKILEVLEKDDLSRGCEPMLLTLLGHLVSLYPPKITSLLKRMVLVSSKSVSSGNISARPCALNLLLQVCDKSVLQSTPEWTAVKATLEHVLPGLVALLTEPMPRREATTLLQLLCKVTKVPDIKRQMIPLLDFDVVGALLNPLIVQWHPSRRTVPVDDAVYYVQVLFFISKFVQDPACLQLFSDLSEEKCVLVAIATALKFGPPAIAYEILKLPSVIGFSDGSLVALSECLSQATGTGTTAIESKPDNQNEAFFNSPELFGDEERARLENLLSRLEQSDDVPMSALTAVLEYRAAADAREVRLLNAGLESANLYNVHLRQQVDTSKKENHRLLLTVLDIETRLDQCKVERDCARAAEAAAQSNASKAFKASEEKVRLLEAMVNQLEKTSEALKKTLEDSCAEKQKLMSSVQTYSQDLHNLQERHKADLRLLVERENEIKEKNVEIAQLELIKNAINDITSGKKKVGK